MTRLLPLFLFLNFLAGGDEVFGSLLMNCRLVQMAHCCFPSACPFNDTLRAGASFTTAAALQLTVGMWDAAGSLCVHVFLLLSGHNVTSCNGTGCKANLAARIRNYDDLTPGLGSMA